MFLKGMCSVLSFPLNKSKRLIVMSILSLVLVFSPVFIDIYHVGFYLAVLAVAISVGIYRIVCEEKLEQKFHRRWGRLRKQGFGVNLARESLQSLLKISIMVSGVQFLGYDRTPLEVILMMPRRASLWISFLFLTFSLIAGIAAWHENEKKYSRINNNLEHQRNKASFYNRLDG